jgi:hypothetical protein
MALAAYLIGAGEAVEDFILPAPEFLLALSDQDVARHVGLANLTLDADSVVRHFRARFAIAPAARAWSARHLLSRMCALQRTFLIAMGLALQLVAARLGSEAALKNVRNKADKPFFASAQRLAEELAAAPERLKRRLEYLGPAN